MTEMQSNCEAGAWRLEGPLTIYTVEAIRAQMVERLPQPDGLTLDLGAVDSCDCAGLQLLCSAHKSAIGSGSRFQISQFSPAIVKAAEGIGLSLEAIQTHSTPTPV